jgi:hypothetical protein
LHCNWTFITSSNDESLNGILGNFECIAPVQNNHGPVRVKNQFHFEYSDKTSYFPFGKTCYAWIHQSSELQEKTIKTLGNAPFNKMRMCVFPKHYNYNYNEPLLFPFEGSLKSGFNYEKFNTEFFRQLENRIFELQKLSIECDLILFHPYDRWGFSNMGAENDFRYLKYVVSRLSSFRNIWWSLANEYDLMESKKIEDWDRFARIIQRYDPYNHLCSIHNCSKFFDYCKPWVTHCSIQRTDPYKSSENTDMWRKLYEKPIVIDECVYEGNIDLGWGNINGQELTRRFWEGLVRGGYVGHGETYVHPKDILWWSHGGDLHGTSPSRIAFLRKIVEDAPGAINPVPIEQNVQNINWDVTVGCVGEDYYIYYFGLSQPSFRNFKMPEGKKYHIEIIDTWDMNVSVVSGTFCGDFRLELPGKPYIALRFKSIME